MFKGGFVLRHAFGNLRFSKDLDATRDRPPKHKFNAGEISDSIRRSGIGDQVRFDPGQPATDTARSLDFDRIKVDGALISQSDVQVEISYREAIVDPPLLVKIGEPFYQAFTIGVLQPHEIAAEKLRTLAQRIRTTDLADLAVVLSRDDVADEDVVRVAATKFEIVAAGQANRVERIQANLVALAADYDATVPGLFPGAPSYSEAMGMVWPRIRPLIP